MVVAPNKPAIEDQKAVFKPSINWGTLPSTSAALKFIKPKAIPKKVPKIPMLVSIEGAAFTVRRE